MPFEKVSIKEILEKELSNKEVSAYYDRIKKEYELIEQIVLVRKKLNITESELARRLMYPNKLFQD